MTLEPSTPMGTLACADYAVLDATVPVSAAHAALAGRLWGVVVDPEGTPVGVVIEDDLRRAEQGGAASLLDPVAALSPAVVTDAATTIGELVDSSAVTLLDLGVRGLVVQRDGELAGVVPASEVSAFLAAGGHVSASRTMGPHGDASDATLGGRPETGLANVVCAAPGCGFVNKCLVFYDPDNPPACVNPSPRPTDC